MFGYSVPIVSNPAKELRDFAVAKFYKLKSVPVASNSPCERSEQLVN